MDKFIILTDTRQQKEQHILEVFDNASILHFRTTLSSADYMVIRYNSIKGFYKDYSILIDTKKNLEEVANNLCNSKEHERIKREIAKGKELGAKQFIFLIGDDKINCVDDLKKWNSKRTKVKGSTLFKIMNTMQKKYGIKFIICKKKDMGKYILKLFKKE